MPGRLDALVNTYDTAVTLAWILDVPPPQCWTGRVVAAAFGRDAVTVSAAARPALPHGCTADSVEPLPAVRTDEGRAAPGPRDQR